MLHLIDEEIRWLIHQLINELMKQYESVNLSDSVSARRQVDQDEGSVKAEGSEETNKEEETNRDNKAKKRAPAISHCLSSKL